MVLINNVLNVLMKLFKYFFFYFYEQKYSVFSLLLCFIDLFWRFIFLTFIFAQCIRAMYMYIFQTKVKSLTMNVFFNNLWFYVSYNFHRSGSYQDRGADHLTVACKSIKLRMNLLGIFCLNVHCASEIWSSGCVLFYKSFYWNKKISWFMCFDSRAVVLCVK